MTKTIITQAEFANIVGVSKQSVGYAADVGNIKLTRQRKVVFSDPMTKLWMEKRQAKMAKQSNFTKEPQKKPVSGTSNTKTTPKVQKNSGKSLSEIKIEEEIRKIRADIRLKDLKYSRDRGDLIEKDRLATVLFKYLDALNIAVLDTPDMIIDLLIDGVKSGMSRGDLVKMMREKLKSPILSTKKQINERLK